MWLGPLGLDAGRLKEGNSFTDASLALDAAIAGQGVLLACPTLAADALRSGTLVAPFKERVMTGIAYWLVTSATRREPKTVRDFKAWIRDEMKETEAMFGA
jgi:DNA-binding transcriptional LysR family regulator